LTAAEKVIAAFRRRLGVTENPPGSNDDRGGWITYCNGRWGMRYVPWCGTSSDTAYADGGVDDGGLGSPSTAQIVANARAAGRLRSKPVPGCYIIWRPGSAGHVEVAQKALSPTAWLTVGGNTGDAVRDHIRDIRGAYFAVPPALDEPPAPVYRTVYWWEDPKAKPVRHGLYAAIASREKAVRAWVAKHGNPGHVRRGKLSVMRDGRLVPRYTFWTGQRRRSPDFTTKAKRDANMKKVAAQTGHTLRPRSKRVRVS
jgi:hypothetical protein